MRIGAWIFLAALPACVVPKLDLDMKRCPCATGYVCDATSQTCVGLGGSIEVSDLRVEWTTPNQIRWGWAAAGPPEQFREYQLLVAESQSDLEAREGTATVWTLAQNPEMGRFFLPRTGGQDQTTSTTTDLHQPAALYFGQLIAIDTAGHATVSNVMSARTTDPPVGSLTIFDETMPPGYTIPAAPVFQPSSDRPYAGQRDVTYLAPPPCTDGSKCVDDGSVTSACEPCCAPGSTACFKSLRFANLAMSLSAIERGSFDKLAYLELALATDASVPSYWSELRLWFGDGSSIESLYSYQPWTVRGGNQYRVIQVPLRTFAHHTPEGQITATAPYCQLVPQPAMMCTPPSLGGLHEVGIGGLWTVGATVRIDSIKIFY